LKVELHCKAGRFQINSRIGKVVDAQKNEVLLRPKPMSLLIFLIKNIDQLTEKKRYLKRFGKGRL